MSVKININNKTIEKIREIVDNYKHGDEDMNWPYEFPHFMRDLRELFTYCSDQHTKCAVCGEDKHTPLRIDSMGGYVCLTCINNKLENNKCS